MGVPLWEYNTRTEFTKHLLLLLDSFKRMDCKQERFETLGLFFRIVSQNLKHLRSTEGFKQFGRVVCLKLKEFSNGGVFEQRVAAEYGWVVAELEKNIYEINNV